MKRRNVLAGLATASIGLPGCLDGDDAAGDRSDGSGAATTELAGTSFRVESSGCTGREDGATVTTDGGAVVVDGTIVGGPDAATAAFRGAALDADGDVLRVSVGTVTEGNASGCPTAIGYAAEVGFEGGPPAATAVYHDGVRVDAVDGPARIASFTVTGVETSPPRDEATVRRRSDGRIVVDGAIAGPDGCTTAALDGVAYDAGRERLAVDVVALERTTPPCRDGTVEIGYELELGVPAGAVRRADVAHDGDVVASASWRDDPASGNVSDAGE